MCHKCALAAPAFPGQAFPNGYPGYPLRGDSQPSITEEHGHSLMGLEDQVSCLTAAKCMLHVCMSNMLIFFLLP